MKINQLKAGSLLSYVQMIVSVVINLVYTPVMLRLLGQSEYGLYNTVASTISMLTIFSVSSNSVYVKFYAKYKSEGDEESIQKLNGMFLLLFSVIAVVAVLCGAFLSFNLELVFSDGLTAGEYQIAKVLMLLLTFNLAFSFPMGVFVNIITAQERFFFLKLAQMGKTIVGPLVTLPLLLMGYRSIAMVAVTVGVSIVTDFLHLFYVFVILKQKFKFRGFEKGLLGKIFSFSYLIIIQVIVEQVNWNIDKILLGRFQGTESVSVYSVGYSLFSYYMLISFAVSNVFAPRIYHLINIAKDKEEKKEMLTQLFTRVGRIQFLVLMLFATGLTFFGRPFIAFWAGGGYEESYYIMLILVWASSIDLMQNVGIEIQRGLNKQKFRTVLYSFMALINLGMSIVLGQMYGAIGCAMGTAISLLVANGLIINVYYHKQCNLNIAFFWKSILRASMGLIVPAVCGILLMKFIDFSSVWTLLACIVGYAGVYCISMWLIGMNSDEKEIIKKPLRKLLRR